MNGWVDAQLSQCIGHSWWTHLKRLKWLNEQLIGSFTFKGNSVPINSHTPFPLKCLLALSSVQSLSLVWLFATPWNAAHPASLSITNSQSWLRLTSIRSVMPSSHLTLCRLLLPLPSILPSIRVFSNESVLWTRWPNYWDFSFSTNPSNEYSGLISCMMDWFDLLAVQGALCT